MIFLPLVEIARPDDREAALRLVFQHLPADEREKRVANALHLIELGTLASDGLFIVRGRQSVSGAMLGLPIPGAGALVWPPQAIAGTSRHSIEDALVQRMDDWLRQRGVKLGQALLTKDESSLADPLVRNGYRPITSLLYMRRAPAAPPSPAGHSALSYQPFQADDSALFGDTLLRTYEGTLDCPEVNGVRTVAEILEGHRADAGPRGEHWWLALEGGQPVGVLLLSESAEWESWEVAYVGVVPEARRRGFGRELLTKAILESEAREAPQLTLCVDARNGPALRLYQELGFEPYAERDVYLAVF
jgi:ribosomal protein S18 acetylase RimI-like enzyme